MISSGQRPAPGFFNFRTRSEPLYIVSRMFPRIFSWFRPHSAARGSTSVFYHYIGMQYTIPHQGILPLHSKLYQAIAPRRRRMTPSAARERSSHVLDGAILGSTWTCTNYIHIHPQYKSFAELFQKRPFPSFPLVPLVPPRSPVSLRSLRTTIKHPSTCERSRRRGA